MLPIRVVLASGLVASVVGYSTLNSTHTPLNATHTLSNAARSGDDDLCSILLNDCGMQAVGCSCNPSGGNADLTCPFDVTVDKVTFKMNVDVCSDPMVFKISLDEDDFSLHFDYTIEGDTTEDVPVFSIPAIAELDLSIMLEGTIEDLSMKLGIDAKTLFGTVPGFPLWIFDFENFAGFGGVCTKAPPSPPPPHPPYAPGEGPSSDGGVPIVVIAAAAGGAVVVVLAIIGGVCLCRRQQQRAAALQQGQMNAGLLPEQDGQVPNANQYLDASRPPPTYAVPGA